MNNQILKHIIRYILMILIIIVASFIFGFSAQNANESGGISQKISTKIVEIVENNKNLDKTQIEEKSKHLEPFIRKLAHFSIYALLGILFMSCATTFKGMLIKKFIISYITIFLYACTDEFHQRFVPGRSGQFSDVCLDITGALLGIAIVLLITIIVRKIKEHNFTKTKILLENDNKKNVVFIASTGGHLNELMQIKPLFKKYNYHIITEKTLVDESMKEEYGNKLKFLIYGTKKYPISYIFKFTANCFISLYYFFKIKPEVVVTTGTHTAVPMCYIAKIFGSKIIFIETFANRETGTVAGKIVYPIADIFVVQWEEMHKIYPKSVCWGWLY